jgi:hypothetical protein
MCPVCQCPALRSWTKAEAGECGVLCLACSTDFVPVESNAPPVVGPSASEEA